MDPERVAITSPSSGVKPIVVSTDRPPSTAASEAPAPRWQVTTRSAASPARPQQLRGPPRGVRVRQPVEPVPPEVPALAPRRRDRVRATPRRASWRGTRCRSTRRAGTPGSAAATAAIAASDRGWWSGASGDSASMRGDGRVVDERPARRTASRRGRPGARPRRRRPNRAIAVRDDRGVGGPDRRGRSAVAEDASSGSRSRSLQAARPALTTRIRPARGLSPATSSAAISGASSPSSRVYARASIRLSTISCRTCPALRREPGHPVDDVDHEVEPVEVVEHDHVERRRGRALLLVAADVEVAVVRPAVGQPVDQPRVAVVGEHDRLVAS